MSGAIKVIRRIKLDKKLFTAVITKKKHPTQYIESDDIVNQKMYFKKTQRRGWVSTKWGESTINME